MTNAIEVIPEGWWPLVLVGMSGINELALKAWRNSARTKDGTKPRYNADLHRVKSGQFDNAIAAGWREREACTVVPTRNRNQHAARLATQNNVAERIAYLATWMASFGVQPYLVQPALSTWPAGRFTVLEDLRALEVEPICWEYDEDGMYRVPVPRPREMAA